MIKNVTLQVALLVLASHAATEHQALAGRDYIIGLHDVNQVEFHVTNYGKYGQKAQYTPGVFWPKGSGHAYVYAGGPWFGAIVGGDTLVTVGYAPLGGYVEFVPGLADMDPSDPEAIFYMFPTLWPPPLETYPMAPQDFISHQDSWCAFNDLDINAHVPGDTRPIGLEVYQSIYAWNVSNVQDILYLKYEFKNVSGHDLYDCHIGLCADNDIGISWNDIAAGILHRWYVIAGDTLFVDNVGYQWQLSTEPGWSSFPGVIAHDFLQSPWDCRPGYDKDNDGIPDEHERDSAYYVNNLPVVLWDVDGDLTPDWRDPSQIPQLGMTAFKQFIRFQEPNLDRERYLILSGRDFVNGEYEPYDTATSAPEDRRFIQCSGPFSMPVDSTVVLVVAIMFAEWFEIYNTPDSALAVVDQACQYAFDMSWSLPGPPAPPRLACIPGDACITLIWDNGAESTPDPAYEIVSTPGSPVYEPFYLQYDFEGYRVWKSISGQLGEWRLLASFDLVNHIIFEDSLGLRATDTGVTHFYVDNDVRNGFDYTYAVTAFDNNYIQADTIDSLGNPVKTAKPLRLETSKFPVSAIPRREPANFVAGRCSVEILAGNKRLIENLCSRIVYPLAMIDTTLHAAFTAIEYDTASQSARYCFRYSDENSVIQDSTYFYADDHASTFKYASIPVRGVAMDIEAERDSIPTNESIFDTILVVTGTYPDSLLMPALPGPWATYFATWGYRGNDYEIHWISTAGHQDANTVVVIDTMSKDTIPYRAYNPESDHCYDSLADGWCFLSHLDVSDTLVLFGSPPITHNTKYLFINGGLIGLKRGGYLHAGDALPGNGDVWRVRADTTFHPAPAVAHFAVRLAAAYFDTMSEYTLNVKVVPNPFLVHNEWCTSVDAPKVRFINLPADCTIRIFTLAGELIKTIRHHHTLPVDPGHEEVMNDAGGDEWWHLMSDTNNRVVSGVYIFHIQSHIGEQVGKFVVIR